MTHISFSNAVLASLVVGFCVVQPAYSDPSTGLAEAVVLDLPDSAYQQSLVNIEANRDSIVINIVDRMRPIAEERGFEGWEPELTQALQDAEAEALMVAQKTRSYEQVVQALSEFQWAGPEALLASDAGGVGLLPPQEVLGSNSNDLVFTPVTPCRIVDTRSAGGKIASSSSRAFYVHGTTTGQGGGVCNNPNFDPTAAVLNVTVVDPDGPGHIRIYPEGAALPLASLINFNAAGQMVANAVVAKTSIAVGRDFRIYAGRRTHVVVDLMGFFAAPHPTTPQRQVVSASAAMPDNTDVELNSPSCPTGYQLSGGGCHFSHFDNDLMLIGSRPWSSNRWRCDARNDASSGSGRTVMAHAVCLRIPGR